MTVQISPTTGHPFLSVSRLELLDAVLNLCAYHHPKDIILPAGYEAGFSFSLYILALTNVKLTETFSQTVLCPEVGGIRCMINFDECQ